MSTTPTIRLARPDDREDIWRLLGDLAISFTPDRACFDPALDATLRAPDTLAVVADVPDTGVVGYLIASCRTTLFANGPEVWVAELIVDERLRRSGVGRALMTSAESWARERGATRASLATSRAHDFYRALGYEGSSTYYCKTLT